MNKTLRSVVAAFFAGAMLLGTGCSTTPPSPPEDKTGAAVAPAEPAAAQPAATAPVSTVVSATTKSEAPKTADKPAVKPAVKPPVVIPPKLQATAPATPTLALDTLEQRLKDTPAIGVFTKLTLKNQVDDLLDRFRAYYEGRGGLTIAQLRQHYDQLLAKVHGLLKDGDPLLASAVVNSREAIWGVLTDPAKFAKL